MAQTKLNYIFSIFEEYGRLENNLVEIKNQDLD